MVPCNLKFVNLFLGSQTLTADVWLSEDDTEEVSLSRVKPMTCIVVSGKRQL